MHLLAVSGWLSCWRYHSTSWQSLQAISLRASSVEESHSKSGLSSFFELELPAKLICTHLGNAWLRQMFLFGRSRQQRRTWKLASYFLADTHADTKTSLLTWLHSGERSFFKTWIYKTLWGFEGSFNDTHLVQLLTRTSAGKSCRAFFEEFWGGGMSYRIFWNRWISFANFSFRSHSILHLPCAEIIFES